MMTQDPFQNFQTIGAYSGGVTPYGVPYTPFQQSFNPMALSGQQWANPGIGGYGAHQQHLQGAGFVPTQQSSLRQSPLQQNPLQQLQALNPLIASLQQTLAQNPLLAQHILAQSLSQNPFAQTVPQNPYAQTIGQNPYLNAGMQIPFAQAVSQNPFLSPVAQNPFVAQNPWAQHQQQQFGYPLAPQSLIGGIGQPGNQFNPLAQLALRQATGYGVSPVACAF